MHYNQILSIEFVDYDIYNNFFCIAVSFFFEWNSMLQDTLLSLISIQNNQVRRAGTYRLHWPYSII